MKRVEIGPRGAVMHAPKRCSCLYSGIVIEEGEVAVTFSSDISGYTNAWLALSEVGGLVEELRGIYEGPPEAMHDREFAGDIDVIISSMKGECIACGSYHDPYRDGSRGFNGIVEFSEESDFRGSPYLHVNCIEDFIGEQLEVVFDRIDSADVLSRRL